MNLNDFQNEISDYLTNCGQKELGLQTRDGAPV